MFICDERNIQDKTPSPQTSMGRFWLQNRFVSLPRDLSPDKIDKCVFPKTILPLLYAYRQGSKPSIPIKTLRYLMTFGFAAVNIDVYCTMIKLKLLSATFHIVR